jgi:hypothetical protein
MMVSTSVVLAMGLILILAIVRGLAKKVWPSDRQFAGLFAAGLILLLIGRASGPLAKGLAWLMALAVFVTQGGIPGVSAITKTTPATTTKPATTGTAKK